VNRLKAVVFRSKGDHFGSNLTGLRDERPAAPVTL
jgi:hypothetical protein